MTSLLAPAIIFSFAIIALLRRGDPKRRRVAATPGLGHRPAKRRVLAVLAFLPGFVIAGTGDAPAFLVWLGCCALAGWLIAQLRPAPELGQDARRK